MIPRGSPLSLLPIPFTLGQPGTPTNGREPAISYLLPPRQGRQWSVLTGLSETTRLVRFSGTRLDVTGRLDRWRPDRILFLCRSTLRILVRPTHKFLPNVVLLTMVVTERTFRFFILDNTTLVPTLRPSPLPPPTLGHTYGGELRWTCSHT